MPLTPSGRSWAAPRRWRAQHLVRGHLPRARPLPLLVVSGTADDLGAGLSLRCERGPHRAIHIRDHRFLGHRRIRVFGVDGDAAGGGARSLGLAQPTDGHPRCGCRDRPNLQRDGCSGCHAVGRRARAPIGSRGRPRSARVPRHNSCVNRGYISSRVPTVEGDEQPAVLDAIREFVGISPAAPELDTILSTVLFTDVVGSTQKQAELGDRRYKGLIEQHHAIVRDALERWRGLEYYTAGDGFYATFDGPARAIRCARRSRIASAISGSRSGRACTPASAN